MANDQSNPNSVLVGKIVGWTNLEETKDRLHRNAGCGEIVAALSAPLILVNRLLSRQYDDDEPPFMIVLSLEEPSLMFFDTEDAYWDYLNWLGPVPDDEGEPLSDQPPALKH